MTEAALPPTEHGPPPVAPLVSEPGRKFNPQGLIVSIITTTLAFLVGGLVVLATGHNPFTTYKAIFNGTGLNWFFPWVTGLARANAAINLQQTLLITTPLILCGLAVAFAFRCGMFNIGGQGQYFAGSYAALILGSYWSGIPGALLQRQSGCERAGLGGVLGRRRRRAGIRHAAVRSRPPSISSPICCSDTWPLCSPTICPSNMTRIRSESDRISSSSSETRRIARPLSRSATRRR